MHARRRPLVALTAAALLSCTGLLGGSAGAATAAATGGTVGGFAYGEMQATTRGAPGCGTNTAGEPSVHVTKDNLVAAGSEDGIGSGSEFWAGKQTGGTATAGACDLTYRGQPNAIAGHGAAGGDIDIAVAPQKDPATGTYRIYVGSLNLASINVATSGNDGKTFSQTPVQAGVPVDDREWLAADGPSTSLLTYHDVVTNNIDVLRSTNGGKLYTQVSQAIPATDYKAKNNELGNVVVDHVNRPSTRGFYAYQSFVAPSSSSGSDYNEAFVAVSSDGGSSWKDKPVPCSTRFGGVIANNFPNVSVAPNGALFYAVSNGKGVYVASSKDHGDTWNCSSKISTPSAAVYPWLVATDKGEDLVYYGATGTGAAQRWSVYFAQNATQDPASGWTTRKLMPVHSGTICQDGVTCSTGRQLLDDFGIDTDQQGWAHIVYSHDGPDLGGPGSYTGYAVQQTGTPAGKPN